MTDQEKQTEKKPLEVTVSRRMFFLGAIGGGTALAGAAISTPVVRETLFRIFDQQPLSERMIDEATANRRSALWTVLETIGVWAANIGLGALVDKLGIHHGGRAADGELYAEQADEYPVSLYVQECWILPVIEEGFFRLFPSSLFSEEQPPDVKLHWGTGLTSAAIFAAIHNFSKPEPDKITFHMDSLPLEQFVLGVYCWWAQRKGGFGHAAGGHVLYNHLCEAYWQLYEKKQLEQQSVADADSGTEQDPSENADS